MDQPIGVRPVALDAGGLVFADNDQLAAE